MTKKILCSVCVAMVLLLTGCGAVWHKENIEEAYKDYWNYSLGNYDVRYEVCSDNGGGSGGFTWNKWYKYTFAFIDINNQSREIAIDNYRIHDFNDNISNAAASFLEEDLENLFKNRVFQKMEGVKANYSWFRCSVKRIDETIDLYDPGNGLQFNKLSLNTLGENNISIELCTYIYLEKGIDDYPDLKQKLRSDVSFIFEQFDYSNIKLCFYVRPSDDYNGADYYLHFDGTQYIWETNGSRSQ